MIYIKSVFEIDDIRFMSEAFLSGNIMQFMLLYRAFGVGVIFDSVLY